MVESVRLKANDQDITIVSEAAARDRHEVGGGASHAQLGLDRIAECGQNSEQINSDCDREGWRLITMVRGVLREVGEETLTLSIEPLEIEVAIPESVRRQLQARLGEMVSLHTVFDIEGNQMSGRLRPRLIGFLNVIDREFFEIFCSVDGVGVRKALRAMVRPVRDLARTIQDQDLRTLATYPGIGEAMAERIVAKLRRKVGKFALIVSGRESASEAEANGADSAAEPDVLRDTFAALLSVGHSESQARQMIDLVLAGSKRKYKSVADMIDAIYQQNR